MKKYLMILAMVFCMGSLLAGCGSKEKEETAEQETDADASGSEELVAPSMDGIDLDKVVTLGEYRGISIEREVVEVTEEEVDAELNYLLNAYPEDITEGVGETGDTLDIAYVGTVDGEEFDSSESYSVTIGAGSNIEGFEEGLVGTTVGQELDLNLTFPADYSEELGGKDAVFNITVNSIKRPLAEPTDEWAAANTDYATVDECKAGIRENLESSSNETAEETMKSNAWQQVVEASTINEYPEEIEAYGISVYKSQFESFAAYSGMTLEEYVEEQGVDMEEFEESAKEYGKTVAAQVLVANAIGEKENLKVGDDQYQEMLQEYLDSYGMEEEEFFEQYPRANVDQSILLDRVRDLIIENADIKDVKAEADDQDNAAEGRETEGAEESEGEE